MDGFDVTAGELAAGAEFAQDAQAELAAELNRIAALVGDVLGTSWRGDAASAFGVAWSEWAAGARDVVGALAAMAASLRASGTSYLSAEQASALPL